MLSIESYEQFTELKNKAVSEKKYKLTNFLVSDDEMKLHIANGRVCVEENDNFLCVVVHIREYDYLYFWCADKSRILLPNGTNNQILTIFGNKTTNNDWGDVAERFGLKQKSKLLQVVGKIDELTYPQYPSFIRKSFKFEYIQDYTFDYYCNLARDYFDFENDIFPEKYVFDELFINKLNLVEVRTLNNDFVAFYTYTAISKSYEGYVMAVMPKYRGIGFQPLLLQETMQGYKYFKSWVQDWNKESWRVMESMGIKLSGNYRVLYGR
ncbi:MAG: hypothetical protein LBM93_01870 [Oscillospiraceae bacterium]|jgi:GNAT superfamily N-acetyltransferase|nr:hypothetical protein [Oscillospiraceae bacterium]